MSVSVMKGCLNSTKIPKVGIPKAGIPKLGIPKTGIPKLGIPKTGIPKAGLPKVGKTHTGTLPETEIPKPGIPKSGIPKTGIPKAGIPKLGIPKTGRFTAPLIQTPLRLPLNLGPPTVLWPSQIQGVFLRSRPGKPNQRKGQNEKFMNFAHFCENSGVLPWENKHDSH